MLMVSGQEWLQKTGEKFWQAAGLKAGSNSQSAMRTKKHKLFNF